MSKRMLIDGAHPEEIRVVVTSGNKLDEYDIETTFKKQIKGNIYLAKVTRVEPSLQAAFVDFGGNRHGFLAFSEIHPDYYQIPVEDRQALIEEQEALEMKARAAREHLEDIGGDLEEDEGEDGNGAPAESAGRPDDDGAHDDAVSSEAGPDDAGEDFSADRDDHDEEARRDDADGHADPEPVSADPDVEEALEAAESAAPRRTRGMRRYKIQEVIKRRQILLVQVVKEERGNKGAALTTYISLAGRYCVLMPNSSRGGGISRKITSVKERRKLRDTLNALDIPQGMGVIIRTAGLERNKAEIRRDFEYLIRAWDEVREVTLESSAPSLVYEEGNIIKRAIRDIYSKDIDEIMVDGADTYQTAKKFMRLMMPSHAKFVQPYRDEAIPLFQRFQIEQQLDAMHNPEVQLKSGGYIVINPTEALVAIDVNSGKSTRERNIEETATKTNLEAADEVARQLRLRDLAGLIVIDFIDMEDSRNIRKVERRLKDAMKVDRARLQIGHISNFGLLELSRQRLRPSLLETSSQICPHCRGTGNILSTESMAMRVLRAIEEEGIRMRSSEITVRVQTAVALYTLNHKRGTLAEMEGKYGFQVMLEGDDSVIPPDIDLERVKGRPEPLPTDRTEKDRSVADAIAADAAADDEAEALAEAEAAALEDEATEATETTEPGEARTESDAPKRRRRRSRRKPRDSEGQDDASPATDAEEDGDSTEKAASDVQDDGEEKSTTRRRRRGRRGGRRRNRTGDQDGAGTEAGGSGEGESRSADSRSEAPQEARGADTAAGWEATESPAAADTAAVEDVADEAPAASEPEETERPAPAEKIDVEAVAEAEAEDAAEDEAEASSDDASPDPTPGPAPEPVADRQPEPAMAAEPASNEPKRRGWWQRMVE